jgi:hypothetical protein
VAASYRSMSAPRKLRLLRTKEAGSFKLPCDETSPCEMTMWPISTRVNRPENDDADLLTRSLSHKRPAPPATSHLSRYLLGPYFALRGASIPPDRREQRTPLHAIRTRALESVRTSGQKTGEVLIENGKFKGGSPTLTFMLCSN